MKRVRSSTRRLQRLALTRPRDRAGLRLWVKTLLGLDVPDQPLIPGSSAPLDYLAHSFFNHPGDAIVWANRGGGKTMLGAVATLLDMIFLPGIQIRVLGGSMEQSRKMHEHMLTLLELPAMGSLAPGDPQPTRSEADTVLATTPTRTRIALANGSAVELLAQSQRSVRGTRVHKLRCDEVDEFDPAVWRAAQMVTRSGNCGQTHVRGTIEALSTMHRPFGLMSGLIPSTAQPATPTITTQTARSPAHPDAHPRPVFRWSAIDVIERCPAERPCDSCVLWHDCRGRAKHAAGFIPVDDLIDQWHRTDRATWDAEMMCNRPSRSDTVYPAFDPAHHVTDRLTHTQHPAALCIAGMDFGVRSPTVFLWATFIPPAELAPPPEAHGRSPWASGDGASGGI